MDLIQIAKQCFQTEAESILNLQNLLDNDFDSAVRLIYESKGRVIITGVGKSGLIGAKIAATLASSGTPAFFMHPTDAFHGDLGVITKNDIIIAISYSGTTDEILRLVPFLNDQNIPIISITGNKDSLLAKNSKYNLNIMVAKEACPLDLVPTSSTTATLAMGDAIAVALIHLRDFKKEDFARFHPGGSLGVRLLTKVKDVMRAENLPIVPPNMEISEAIINISASKLGIVIVVENDNVLGIVTDGDVRRAMQKNKEQFFNIKVKDIMTLSPKSINQNAKLIDAQQLLHRNSIHSLLVLDENNKLIGVLDSFKINI